jgi:hypothetical protein
MKQISISVQNITHRQQKWRAAKVSEKIANPKPPQGLQSPSPPASDTKWPFSTDLRV